jgi:hypothetical protein
VSAPRTLALVGARLLGAGALGAAIGGAARRLPLGVTPDVERTWASLRALASRPVWDAAAALVAAVPAHDARLRLLCAAGAVVAGAMAVTAWAGTMRHATRTATTDATTDARPDAMAATPGPAMVAPSPAARAAAAAFLREVEAAARAVDRLGVCAPRRAPAPSWRTRLADLRAVLPRRAPATAAASPRDLTARAAHAAARGTARRPALVTPLAESGATRAEIARRTGLSRDAVALSLNLAARQS